MENLSDDLNDIVQAETYGFFPIPITRIKLTNHEALKKSIFEWIGKEDILEKHGRESICHGISQLGETNRLVNENQELGMVNMEEGDVIIYPSNVTHGFDSNPSNDRITFTANITLS